MFSIQEVDIAWENIRAEVLRSYGLNTADYLGDEDVEYAVNLETDSTFIERYGVEPYYFYALFEPEKS